MIESVVWFVLLTADTSATQLPVSRSHAALRNSFFAQQQNSITGSVSDQSRRPIANLRVELLDEVDGVLTATYTNSAGRYSFYRISTGTFQVRVLTSGTNYQGRTERVQIMGSLLGGRGAQSEQIDFVLPLKKERGDGTSVGSRPGVVFVQEVPREARQAYDQALKEISSNSRDKGLVNLQRAIELFPDYYAALDLLGQEYIKRENYKAAQPVLTRAVSVNARGYSSWYALGYAQYKLRMLPAAVESINKAASINPESVNAQLLLGTLQRIQQQWQDAETHLNRAKSLSKTGIAEVHWQLALLYNQTGRFAKAADELERFLKAQPDSRDAEKIRMLIAKLRSKK